MISGIASGYLGRKKTLMITQTVALVGILVLRFASSVPHFYLGSFLGGCSGGIVNAVVPAYIGEINQPRIRKFSGSFMNTIFYCGFTCTKMISIFLNWRDTVACMSSLPALGLVLICFCPESPTWYMLKGKDDSAIQTMINLRGDVEVAHKEIQNIRANLEKQRESEQHVNNTSKIQAQIKLITKGTFVRPCLVVTILMSVCWQWTGGPVLSFYTDDILNRFDVPIPSLWVAPVIGGYQLCCCVLGIFISSVVPRRKYYMISGSLVFLGAGILGTVVHLLKYGMFKSMFEDHYELKWIPAIGFLIYYLGYNLGYISVCFTLLGELLPSKSKEIGGCIIIQFMNLSFFLALKSANWCIQLLGFDGLFWLFSGVALFSIIFAYFVIPETFGRTLEEMEDHYRKICYPRAYEDATIGTELINVSIVSDSNLNNNRSL